MPSTIETITVAFPTELGWIALTARGETVLRLAFGMPSALAAATAIGDEPTPAAEWPEAICELVRRMQDYAAGKREDLHDIAIESSHLTPFAKRVEAVCRAIPRGEVLSYGEVAQRAGSPGAARAVGNVMARNRCPLIVPCHRVVAGGGRIGKYSGGEGVVTKRRLLDMEGFQSATSPAKRTPAAAIRRKLKPLTV